MLEDSKLLAALTAAVGSARPPGYVFEREAAERHGSWEWILVDDAAGGVVPAVVIAVTDLGGLEGSTRVDVDVWAAAESDDRFVRLPARHAEFVARHPAELLEIAGGILPEAIGAAAEIAARFSYTDLTEAYADASPITRSDRGPEDGPDTTGGS